MNKRPWPLTISGINLVNPTPLTQPEQNQNWNTVNDLIKKLNDLLQNTVIVSIMEKGVNGINGSNGTTADIYPYDGVHDDVPYVITNGVLKDWPATTMEFAKDSSTSLEIDMENGIVYPARLVLPVWS